MSRYQIGGFSLVTVFNDPVPIRFLPESEEPGTFRVFLGIISPRKFGQNWPPDHCDCNFENKNFPKAPFFSMKKILNILKFPTKRRICTYSKNWQFLHENWHISCKNEPPFEIPVWFRFRPESENPVLVWQKNKFRVTGTQLHHH